MRWLLPTLAGSNMILRQLSVGLRSYAWWFAFPFRATAALAAARSFHRRRLLDDQVGLETLRALPWQDFERLVGEAYRRQGFVVEEVGGSAPDGGIDLLLHRGGTKTIVQCKRWKTAQIGVSLIREFYGVTVAEKAERGIFVTTGTYTADALAFARGRPFDLVDGAALAQRVQACGPAIRSRRLCGLHPSYARNAAARWSSAWQREARRGEDVLGMSPLSAMSGNSKRGVSEDASGTCLPVLSSKYCATLTR